MKEWINTRHRKDTDKEGGKRKGVRMVDLVKIGYGKVNDDRKRRRDGRSKKKDVEAWIMIGHREQTDKGEGRKERR